MDALVVDRVLELRDGTTLTAVARRRVGVRPGPDGLLAAGALTPAALLVRRRGEVAVYSLDGGEHTLESLAARLPGLGGG